MAVGPGGGVSTMGVVAGNTGTATSTVTVGPSVLVPPFTLSSTGTGSSSNVTTVALGSNLNPNSVGVAAGAGSGASFAATGQFISVFTIGPAPAFPIIIPGAPPLVTTLPVLP
jgi:hypothetical protein